MLFNTDTFVIFLFIVLILYYLLPHRFRNLYWDDNPNWNNAVESIKKKMKDICDAQDVPFILMIIPDFHNLSTGSPYEKIYAQIDSTFKEQGIPSINTFPIFHERFGNGDRELWIQRDDPHPNEKGHRVMADILFNYLREKVFAENFGFVTR